MRAKGLLLDLEGVLYQDGSVLNGAVEALQSLKEADIQIRYLTNTTTRCRRQIVERIQGYGIGVSEDEVFSPAIATRFFLESKSLTSLFLATESDLLEDFRGFELDSKTPEAVIMGDIHTRFNWATLDHIFALVQSGVCLIALHKNRYCRRDGHISLDLGPFVTAIEYASGVEAIVMGKPDAGFFHMALRDLDLPHSDVVMVGDDPYSDIGGARSAGIRAVQVKTGKYKPLVYGEGSGEAPEPDALIGSIADLPALLEI